MSKKFLAFDIEIAKLLPDGVEDWKAYRPFGITCAATFDGESQPRVWYSKLNDENAAPQMPRDELVEMVRYLERATQEGYTILTWNGLGFDFQVLAEESGLWTECAKLALDHVDMMFHIFCLRGHPLGLDKAARGMNVPGKPPGMSGALAPRYWAEGKWAVVLDYVAQDVRSTLGVATRVENTGWLRWVSDRGGQQSIPITAWLTARQALTLPEPETSWMRNPMARTSFYNWLNNPAG